jgi:hypothetical protein
VAVWAIDRSAGAPFPVIGTSYAIALVAVPPAGSGRETEARRPLLS